MDGATEFFGITESPRHVANECRIAFWAESPSEVDRLAEIIVRADARHVKVLAITKDGLLRGLFRGSQRPDGSQ